MTDLRTLLHEAAPVPLRSLDVAALRLRARRSRSKRLALWFVGLVAVVGVGQPLTSPLLSPAGDEATRLVQTPDRRDAGEKASSVKDETDGPRSPSGSSPSRQAVGLLEQPSEPPAGSAQANTDASTSGAANGTRFPPAASCSVSNDGLAPSAQRVCRFTATAAGGASIRTSGATSVPANGVKAEVRITRDGETRSNELSDESVQAADAGFTRCEHYPIKPGDLVELVMTNSPDPQTGTTTAGAGQNWNCDQR